MRKIKFNREKYQKYCLSIFLIFCTQDLFAEIDGGNSSPAGQFFLFAKSQEIILVIIFVLTALNTYLFVLTRRSLKTSNDNDKRLTTPHSSGRVSESLAIQQINEFVNKIKDERNSFKSLIESMETLIRQNERLIADVQNLGKRKDGELKQRGVINDAISHDTSNTSKSQKPDSVKYVKTSQDGFFKTIDLKNGQNGECIFELQTTGNKGSFNLSKDPNVHHYVKKNPNYYFREDACDIVGIPEAEMSISEISPGEISLTDGQWKITKKISLKFSSK